jgi:hypothetical protein
VKRALALHGFKSSLDFTADFVTLGLCALRVTREEKNGSNGSELSSIEHLHRLLQLSDTVRNMNAEGNEHNEFVDGIAPS